MRLIVDTNIIFAALIRDSVTRRIFSHLNDAEFFILSFNFQEIDKYKKEILEKAKISEPTFMVLFEQLTKKCIIIEDEAIRLYWNEAKEIMWKIDPNDTPFIAAALSIRSDIWSDDTHFLRQKRIRVWKTKDLYIKL
jgi:predicted nucleic acid-binding protein